MKILNQTGHKYCSRRVIYVYYISIKTNIKEVSMEAVALNNQDAKNVSQNVKTISMLYDGAVNFVRLAKKKQEVGDSAGKAFYIRKSSAIIRELSVSLNMDGGEISQNLRKLYEYVIGNLVRAEAHNDLASLDDAEKVIEILRSAWKEMQEANKY
ncbi:MAG: flagellar export chaperone FliS [Nitrospiraceae bacterium]|nr:MAG: flagellar export chaperone FliS [Nitrospiraceae bacterium]